VTGPCSLSTANMVEGCMVASDAGHLGVVLHGGACSMVATTVFCLGVEQHWGLRWLGFLHLSQLLPKALHSFCLSASLFVTFRFIFLEL
jgi:hypothetical protein